MFICVYVCHVSVDILFAMFPKLTYNFSIEATNKILSNCMDALKRLVQLGITVVHDFFNPILLHMVLAKEQILKDQTGERFFHFHFPQTPSKYKTRPQRC